MGDFTCKKCGTNHGAFAFHTPEQCDEAFRIRAAQPPQSPDPRDERIAEMHKDSEYKWRETAEQLARERDEARARVKELEAIEEKWRGEARRLQAECERLKGTPIKVDYDGGVISVNGEPIADHSELPRVNERLAEENFRLREALEFYAKGGHFSYHGDEDGEPENPSGEPPNWLCGNGEFTYEDGSIARQALAAHSPVDNADAPAPSAEQPATMKSEQDSDKFHEICPTHEQMRCLEAVACAAEKAMSSEVVKRAPFAGYSEALANLREALARLRDSGWRG